MAKKILNSDIYNVAKLVDDVKKNYIPEESESTLAIGTFGYIGAIESKRLQSQVIMTGELCNESFPSRARLERNIITHAIMANIENINAIPAKMNAILGIRYSDIKDLFDSTNKFYIDRECPIYVGEFEFHLEYDIILRKIKISNNETVYTAQYDVTRNNPSSEITSPYISAPAVVIENGETYIFINVILSQVIHNVEYTKLVTSNVIDNKTITFTFDPSEQLAYFEVHISESDDDIYLTPVFEGSNIPNGVNYYCWYQYIDTNIIRVRFDRNSYMPGLNSEIEVQIKTTKGAAGNFSYNTNIETNLESSIYGYKNISILITPSSESLNGRDRKSKKELQSLIPKELLARGSLTTISDLNNYFDMINSTDGRIVIQKKIDNQKERVYYAYLVLKDSNDNVIPSNTIDLNIPIDQLIDSSTLTSSSPRYVLRSGQCIKLGADGFTGELVTAPLVNSNLDFLVPYVTKGSAVTITFKVKVDDISYGKVNIRALVNNKSSIYIETPKISSSGQYYVPDTTKTGSYTDEETGELVYYKYKDVIPVLDGDMVSCGDRVRFKIEYTPLAQNDITIVYKLNRAFSYVDNTSRYYIGLNENETTEITPNISLTTLTYTIPRADVQVGKKYTLLLEADVNTGVALTMENTLNITSGSNTMADSSTFYGILFSIRSNPTTLDPDTELTYTIQYLPILSDVEAHVNVEMSRGLTYYNTLAGSTDYKTVIEVTGDRERTYTSSNPVITDKTLDAGFLYTNPYFIVINKYRMYSAFYMMSVNINPFVHYDTINLDSPIQFIMTNVSWVRDMNTVSINGEDEYVYRMSTDVTQSLLKDMGLISKDGSNINLEETGVKLIAIFFKDGTPYRYKDFGSPIDIDSTIFTYYFSTDLIAEDKLDESNNIKIKNVGIMNQSAEDYGFFNRNTAIKIYALSNVPNISGDYTRYDLDQYVPGLDGWNVTNIYTVVNGVDFYYNYSEIMGSRVIPYGTTTIDDNDNEVLNVEGYTIKGVPVFGYDYYYRDEYLATEAMRALNNRKLYIDDACEKCENSYGIDFKFFNTYGPGHIFYVVKDVNENFYLDDDKIFIDRVNITMKFRCKLLIASDTYIVEQIIKDIKDYMEDLDELGTIHIPNLITQITNDYSESLAYFEFIGINEYGPSVQHLHKLDDSLIPIHTAPEFICINSVSDGKDPETMVPDIQIYLDE